MKTKKVINTAVIGLGRAGWQIHIPQITAHENFKFTAAVDPLESRRKEAREQFGVNTYADCRSLFESEKPDLVVIVSPTHFHKEQAVMAFEHGVDVLCDKPMAVSLMEAREMAAAMRRHKRRMMLYQPHRAYVETVALRHLLAKNLIGRVFLIKRSWCRYRVRVDWQAFSRYGGGELNNSGAHFVDQLLYLAASPVTNMHCLRRKIISKGDAEDFARLILETENGMVLDVEVNFVAAIPSRPMEVYGERGTLILDEETPAWRARYYDEGAAENFKLQNSLAAENRSYMDDQRFSWREATFPLEDYKPVNFYRKCYDYFAGGEEPFIPVEESLEVMRILEECKKKSALS